MTQNKRDRFGEIVEGLWAVACFIAFVAVVAYYLPKETRGEWVSFVIQAAPAAALLAFVFFLIVGSGLSSIFFFQKKLDQRWKNLGRAPVVDPNDTRTALLLGPLLGGSAGIGVGALVALIGWPALWLAANVFGFRPTPAPSDAISTQLELRIMQVERLVLTEQILSIVSVNQTSLTIAVGAGLTVAGTIFTWAALRYRSLIPPAPQALPHDAPTNKPYPRNSISEGFHRVGLAVGVLFGLPLLFIGLFSPKNLVGTAIVATIVFLMPYGFLRLLGWIINGFMGANQRGGKEI